MTTKKAKLAKKPAPRPFRPSESTWAPPNDRGPVLKVTLVGCGKAKAAGPTPARDLYTGALFRASLEHALATANEVRVVSAKYGLVGLDEVIAPYDLRVEDLPTARSRKFWGERVVHALVAAFPGRALEVTLLMGGTYSDLLVAPLNGERIAWLRPLDGYPLGMRLWWLAREKQARTEEMEAQRAIAEAAVLAAEVSPRVVLSAERGQLELPHVGPLSRQLALFG